MVALAVMATAAAAVVALAGAAPEVRAVVPKVFTLNNTRPYPKHKKQKKNYRIYCPILILSRPYITISAM